jgi:hypothetical protein
MVISIEPQKKLWPDRLAPASIKGSAWHWHRLCADRRSTFMWIDS